MITDGKTHELNVARKLRWEPGTIVVFDRAYIDYEWFVELTRQGVYCASPFNVTRAVPSPIWTAVKNFIFAFSTDVSNAKVRLFRGNIRSASAGR